MQPITYQNTHTNICMAILIKEGAIQFQYLEGIVVSNCLPSGESQNIGQALNSSNKNFRRACSRWLGYICMDDSMIVSLNKS